MVFEIKMAGPAKNALDPAMMNFVLDQLREADGRPVLLTGSENAFSAGLNLKVVSRLDKEQMLAFLDKLEHFMSALYLYPAPMAAAINGHAIAGGCVMALCCDYRVVAANPAIKIGLNEVALGVRFPPRIHTIVSRRIPPQHTERVLLGAELFDPSTAFDIGLVDAISEDAVADARNRLTKWGSYSSDTYAATKRDLRGHTQSDLCPDAEHRKRLEEALDSWVSDVVRQRMLAALGGK
jgi:enoyl-CoA hydratase